MELIIYSIVSVIGKTQKLNDKLIGINGISATGLVAIPFKKICAIAGEVNKSELTADLSIALQFASVNEALAKDFSLLPMRLGSVMTSIPSITNMLVLNYNEIRRNLLFVDHKYEFGLKVFCDSEKLKAELLNKSEAGVVAPNNPASKNENSVYREYVNKKLKEHRLEVLVLSYVDTIIEKIIGHLAGLNGVNKIKKMLSATVMVDAVFLIDKKQKDNLIQIVGNLQDQFPELNFVLTGPWPPYNFVEITMK